MSVPLTQRLAEIRQHELHPGYPHCECVRQLLDCIDAQQAEIDRLTTDKNELIAEYGQFKEEQRNARSRQYAERARLAGQVAALRDIIRGLIAAHTHEMEKVARRVLADREAKNGE